MQTNLEEEIANWESSLLLDWIISTEMQGNYQQYRTLREYHPGNLYAQLYDEGYRTLEILPYARNYEKTYFNIYDKFNSEQT